MCFLDVLSVEICTYDFAISSSLSSSEDKIICILLLSGTLTSPGELNNFFQLPLLLL